MFTVQLSFTCTFWQWTGLSLPTLFLSWISSDGVLLFVYTYRLSLWTLLHCFCRYSKKCKGCFVYVQHSSQLQLALSVSLYVCMYVCMSYPLCGCATTILDYILSPTITRKCQEQYKDLYVVFIDLTKAFDSVNRPGLWVILSKIACPHKFIGIVKSFHDGMLASVIDGGSMSSQFIVSCGTKQGCVLAPLLFLIFRRATPRGLQSLQHWCTTGLLHWSQLVWPAQIAVRIQNHICTSSWTALCRRLCSGSAHSAWSQTLTVKPLFLAALNFGV